MSKDVLADIPAGEAPAKRAPLNKYALACAILASMNSILLGYDVSVMSGAQIFMKRDLHITDTQIEVLAGIINIFSLVGSLAAGRTSDWIGRRYTMVLASVIFFAGALIMGLAPGYAVLMLGRFVAGVGVGYALMIAPVYTAEVAPTSARGLLTSFPEVFINTGVLLGYISNYAFHGLPVHLSWRAMFLAGAVPPVFLAVGVLAMPESPRWLVMQGRIGDARRGCALGTAMNRIMSGAITMSFYSLSHKITLAGNFYLYASIAAAGWVFMYCFLPETRGRGLEDTEKLFGGGDGVEKEDGHGHAKSTELTTQ
ncbi:Polyol transporter 5 [Triticum urartu]|uniref:Polyol transporter 5 n=1 Tax=Triticum urartu TaxID=4572 RepID=M7YJJ7_TRIUA|nr:Polyol transporter 5 [Triticum urartu]